MSNYVNIVDLVEMQKNERYKALLILGNLFNMKPDVGKRLASIFGGQYIDLIETFIDDSNLNNHIDIFDSKELKIYLKTTTQKEMDVVIIDGIEMLWSIWSEYEKERFLKMVEKNTISPIRHVVYIFLCIKDDLLTSSDWVNTHNMPRLIDLDDIVIGGK